MLSFSVVDWIATSDIFVLLEPGNKVLADVIK
jgi:hypothetical protein